jgi:ferredoxin
MEVRLCLKIVAVKHAGVAWLDLTPIRRVWIEAGCIACKVCEDLAPDVFLVEGDDTCVIRPDAAARFGDLGDDIEQAARDCPVEVIKFETDDGGAGPGAGR